MFVLIGTRLFSNDGLLDDDHIPYADVDENGNVSVDGEDGKTHEIQLDL